MFEMGNEYWQMRITSMDQLENLTKDALLETATDKGNDKAIQDAALERWLLLDDKDFAESMTKLRDLIKTARRLITRSDDMSAGQGS